MFYHAVQLTLYSRDNLLMPGFRVAVLISGSGSTLLNLLRRQQDGRLHAEICGVVASRDCDGLKHARDFGVPWAIVSRIDPAATIRQFDVQDFSVRVTRQLETYSPELVVLGGFLSPYLPPPALVNRVINVHPALLPEFGGQGMFGRHVHEAVLASGGSVSGCTVHVVDEHYDHGAILAQRRVPILPDDDADRLAQRVMLAEQDLLPLVINCFADGRLTFDAGGSPVLPGGL